MRELLSFLFANQRSCRKAEIILREGDRPSAVGIVLSGCVHIVQEDFFGNRNIIAEIGEGALFGEAFVCAETAHSPVSVVAAGDCEILQIDYMRIFVAHAPDGAHSDLMIKNMLRVLGQKNMSLVSKLEHITKRTTREKVLSYLSEQAKQQGAPTVDIPFNRQELADFLSVERSALSAELSKLRDEGLIEFKKNRFILIR